MRFLNTPSSALSCIGAVGLALMALCGAPAAAQPARPAAPPAATPVQTPGPATGTAASPVPPDPQRTTASFGDWILRCEQPGPGVKLCEAAQIINNQQGQTVAQIAIGRPVRGEPMRLTILVPPSVALVSEMRLLGKDADKPVVSPEIVWRRCLPGGCMADSVLRDDAIAKLRAVTDPYRLGYQDGAGRDTTLPFSTKGLPQVLDALAREEPR